MQGPTAQVANLGLMEGPIGSTLYTEMRRGNTLRLKYPTDLGGYEYSSYSLIGFTRNIRRAVSNCKENSRYFTKSDNSLYL